MPTKDTRPIDEIGPLQANVPCVFIWPSGEPLGKIITRNSRVLVESGDNVVEKHAYHVTQGDQVILGNGSSPWSPADEFTQAVVEGIEASHPELIRDAKAWRQALSKLYWELDRSLENVKRALERVGVQRELMTIEGWLRLERAAPIGPQHINKDLAAMWSVIGTYTETTVDQATAACLQLRSLRSTAGRALIKQWKGEEVDLGVDRTWLAELVSQLREEVEVHEVESLSFGVVPSMMLGWWVSDETAADFELGSEGIMGSQELLEVDQGEDN